MAQSRSPGYPSMALGEAIEYTAKLHEANRTNPTDREAAAKDLGYSGLTGSSAKTLADLIHFGLIEKAGKGGVRVSQRGIDILYPETPAGKAAALSDAAVSPALFASLKAHFCAGAPSDNALRGYLMRQGFASVAIPYVVKSYTDTWRLAQEATAIESHGKGPESPPSAAPDQPVEPNMETVQPTVTAQPVATFPVAFANAGPELNKVNLNIRGDQVHVDALLDYEGLLALEKKIVALKVLLEVVHQANETDETDQTLN